MLFPITLLLYLGSMIWMRLVTIITITTIIICREIWSKNLLLSNKDSNSNHSNNKIIATNSKLVRTIIISKEISRMIFLSNSHSNSKMKWFLLFSNNLINFNNSNLKELTLMEWDRIKTCREWIINEELYI